MKQSPLTVEITEIAAGWIDTKLCHNGNEYKFPISTIWATQDVFFLLGVLYYFHPTYVESYTAEIERFIDEFEDAILEDDRSRAHKAKMRWCAEPSIMDWEIERELTDEPDFQLKIRCTTNFYNPEMTTIIETEVPYKAFCYNVVKEVDKAIKKYGFAGLVFGTMFEGLFNLNHFLFLKSYVLNRMDLSNTHNGGIGHETFSSFEKELELLQLPM